MDIFIPMWCHKMISFIGALSPAKQLDTPLTKQYKKEGVKRDPQKVEQSWVKWRWELPGNQRADKYGLKETELQRLPEEWSSLFYLYILLSIYMFLLYERCQGRNMDLLRGVFNGPINQLFVWQSNVYKVYQYLSYSIHIVNYIY